MVEFNKSSWYSNWKVSIVFVLTGIAIGLLLTIQFRSSIPAATFYSDQLQAQEELIDSYIADQGLLKTKIVGLREQIEEAQQKTHTGDLETLQSLKNEIGLEVVKGPGVEIYLDDGIFVNREDPETISQSLIHASDLRDIINILRIAKVSAIAINDQRIIASTPINSVGNTIMVNNFNLAPPFSIAAIGDDELIMQRFNDPLTALDLQKRANDLNIQFEIKIKEGLLIPKYTGNFNKKYLSELRSSAIIACTPLRFFCLNTSSQKLSNIPHIEQPLFLVFRQKFSQNLAQTIVAKGLNKSEV
jgi:uncharacterized protein YlxW (UPF0749 family)